MFKNVAAKFRVFAFDATTNVPKAGDAANLTAYVSKDYGAVTVLADTSATEEDATNAPGYYLFDAAQGETNADVLMVSGKSSTANIKVIGAPAVIYTRPTTGWLAPATAGRTLVVDAAGLADANVVKAGPTGSGVAVEAWSATRGLAGTALPAAAAGAAGGIPLSTAGSLDLDAQRADVAAILVDTGTTLDGRIPAALVGGRMDANVGAISSDATAADNAESFFDGTGYAGTGNVIPTVTTLTGHTAQTGDCFARLGAPAGASVSADVAAVKVDTGNLVTRITANLFAGITKMAEWLGLIAGKQTGDATARTEIRATGAGSGTYDETTDSTQAIRDRGDAAWTTATGFSTHSAADVWAAATRTLTANTNFNDPTAATIAAAVVGETMTELAAIPSASPTLKQAVALLYMALRNKVTVSATAKVIHNDAGTALGTKSLSDDGTTYTEAEIA